MNVIHKTDYNSALSILQNGFDLNKFGSATKRSGMSDNFSFHPRGIYLSLDQGEDPEYLFSHPWDHKDRGVLIFGSVVLRNPFLTALHVDDKFYQEYLSDQYGSLSGARLSTAMQKDGYDGIYCEETGEVVVFDPRKIIINKEKTNKSLNSYMKWKKENNMNFKEWLILSPN